MSNSAAGSLMQKLGRWEGPSITRTWQVAEKLSFAWRVEAGVLQIFSKKSQARLHRLGPHAYSKNISGKSQSKLNENRHLASAAYFPWGITLQPT